MRHKIRIFTKENVMGDILSAKFGSWRMKTDVGTFRMVEDKKISMGQVVYIEYYWKMIGGERIISYFWETPGLAISGALNHVNNVWLSETGEEREEKAKAAKANTSSEIQEAAKEKTPQN